MPAIPFLSRADRYRPSMDPLRTAPRAFYNTRRFLPVFIIETIPASVSWNVRFNQRLRDPQLRGRGGANRQRAAVLRRALIILDVMLLTDGWNLSKLRADAASGHPVIHERGNQKQRIDVDGRGTRLRRGHLLPRKPFGIMEFISACGPMLRRAPVVLSPAPTARRARCLQRCVSFDDVLHRHVSNARPID